MHDNPALTTRWSKPFSDLGFSYVALLSTIFAWVFWAVLKRFVVKHALDNIPGPPSPSFIAGNLEQAFNPQGLEFHNHLENAFGGVVKLHGLLGDRQLYVTDPKALQHIIVKDQSVYEEPGWLTEIRKMFFGMGLASTRGEHHRKQRKLLNPAFSSSHLREMMPTFYEVSYKLRGAIASKLQGGTQDIDMLHWSGRATLEIIGQAGLGHSFDNFDEGPPNEYSIAVKELMPTFFKLPIIHEWISHVANFGSPGLRRFLVKLLPFRDVQKLREIADIMDRTSVDIFESRKAALQQDGEVALKRGKDIMAILLKANMEGKEEDRLPESELLGQITTFVFAAMDTTSGSLARILYMLAQNPDVQERLRREITEGRASGGDLGYNDLADLPYLDAVIRETMRLFPTVPMIFRVARKDIILPLFKPIVGEDATEIHEIIVPKNTNVVVAILGANRNPDIWGQDAYEWKPERWLSPLPDKVSEARLPGIYSNMMTFSGGGRSCIGFMFAQLEMKVVLSTLLESFSFSLTEKEIVWNMVGAISPSVRDAPAGTSQLPLRVTPVRSM